MIASVIAFTSVKVHSYFRNYFLIHFVSDMNILNFDIWPYLLYQYCIYFESLPFIVEQRLTSDAKEMEQMKQRLAKVEQQRSGVAGLICYLIFWSDVSGFCYFCVLYLHIVHCISGTIKRIHW